MPAETNTIGVVGAPGGTYVESFDRTLRLMKSAELKNNDGSFVEDNDFDPCNEYALKGLGDIETALAAGSVVASDGSVITSATAGKTVVYDTDEGDNSSKYNEWSANVKNWPSAS